MTTNTESILDCFAPNVQTTYIENITNKCAIDGLSVAFFKAIWYDAAADPANYCYAERLYINGRSCLKLGHSRYENYRLAGLDIDAEDPRLVFRNGKLYVIFICLSVHPGIQRGIGISEFDNWNPVFLRVRDMLPCNPVEKNWAPFVKNDELYFVYNYDPLIVLKYPDTNPDGYCDMVFIQDGAVLPINTNEPNILRGGSNLIPWHGGGGNRYYIGACHDRLFYKNRYNYFTHIVVLDVENWQVVYVSKPVAYNVPPELQSELRTVAGTNILYHITNPLIQSPISICSQSDNVFRMTVDVCDCISLLYEVVVDIPRDSFRDYGGIGNIQHKVYMEMLDICNHPALP